MNIEALEPTTSRGSATLELDLHIGQSFNFVGSDCHAVLARKGSVIVLNRFAGGVTALVALLVLGMSAEARASLIELDCQAGCSLQSIPGDPGGALWSTVSVQPSGTGVFKPFLRVHATPPGTEDGHNTDAASQTFLNDEIGGIWTHAVLMSDLDNVVTIDSLGYYEFRLDLGEPAEDRKSLLSLDSFKICTANSGLLVKANDCPTSPYNYDLDAGTDDRRVLLDYNLFGGGNGNSDLFVYIPKSALNGASPYFYLYTAFGSKGGAYGAQGTFEEWSFQHHDAGGGDVPEPTSLVLFGLATFAAAYRIRRRPTIPSRIPNR